MEGTAVDRIRDSWVPIWLKGFERKARDYNSKTNGWEPHTFLGVKGQFADIWRKVGKLKKALWDDETLEGEQPLEIIDDLISHLFLTRDLLLQLESERRRPVELDELDGKLQVITGTFSSEIAAAAEQAIDGDPMILEGMGYILIDSGLGSCQECGTHHEFADRCSYRVRARRHD